VVVAFLVLEQLANNRVEHANKKSDDDFVMC
jgi:hypothetical protein